MAKPEWGTKRLCQGCGTKFYDFGRAPIVCPQCGAEFDPDTLLKSRRSRPNAVAKAAKPAKEAVPAAEAEVEEAELEGGLEAEVEEAEEDVGEGEGEDSGMIEDASELSDDEDVEVVVEEEKED